MAFEGNCSWVWLLAGQSALSAIRDLVDGNFAVA
jgi:hypothetical protein